MLSGIGILRAASVSNGGKCHVRGIDPAKIERSGDALRRRRRLEKINAGLLAPVTIQAMLRENLRRQAINGLFNATDKLAAANFPPTMMEEIQGAVNAVRAQRKRRAPGA